MSVQYNTSPTMHALTPEPTNGSDERITLLDCPIDNLLLEDAVERIEGFLRQGTPHQHVAMNVSKMVMFHRNPRLREVVLQCELVCADGQPLVWLSRFSGTPLKTRVTGIDLMERLLDLAAQKGYRVYFLGARRAALAAAVAECERRHPGLNIVGWSDGYWKPEDEPRVVEAVRRQTPDLLFVALGSPQKEFFIHQYREVMSVPLAVGVGGSFDVIAGITKRAPRWMRGIGLEWCWRILQEPGRMWKRYARDGILFGYLIVKQFLRRTKIKVQSPKQRSNRDVYTD